MHTVYELGGRLDHDVVLSWCAPGTHGHRIRPKEASSSYVVATWNSVPCLSDSPRVESFGRTSHVCVRHLRTSVCTRKGTHHLTRHDGPASIASTAIRLSVGFRPRTSTEGRSARVAFRSIVFRARASHTMAQVSAAHHGPDSGCYRMDQCIPIHVRLDS